MERCPNCRARLSDDPLCRRCGMELDPLRQIERGFSILFAHTLRQLVQDDEKKAVAYLSKALGLRRDPLAKKVLALLRRDRIHDTHLEEAHTRAL